MRPAGRVFTAREQEEGAVRVQGRKKKTETAIFEELLVTTDGRHHQKDFPTWLSCSRGARSEKDGERVRVNHLSENVG